MKKKITKSVIAPVIPRVKSLQMKLARETGQFPVIKGVVFSNKGVQGRAPLGDFSENQTGDILAYWEDESKGLICISAPEEGYEIQAPENLDAMFGGSTMAGCGLSYLDVSHLDVSRTYSFRRCFSFFGWEKDSYIKGLENWDIGNGIYFHEMFYRTFQYNKKINLDLSGWKFSPKRIVNAWGMFRSFGENTEEINLDVTGWDVKTVDDFSEAFFGFGSLAKKVNILGLEDWNIQPGTNVLRMFAVFCQKCDYHLDLSKWNMKDTQAHCRADFSTGNFFRIKEPRWK